MNPETRKTGQFAAALGRLEREIREGLRHGHFQYVIRCEIGRDGVREFILQAGKHHRFPIPVDEL